MLQTDLITANHTHNLGGEIKIIQCFCRLAVFRRVQLIICRYLIWQFIIDCWQNEDKLKNRNLIMLKTLSATIKCLNWMLKMQT